MHHLQNEESLPLVTVPSHCWHHKTQAATSDRTTVLLNMNDVCILYPRCSATRAVFTQPYGEVILLISSLNTRSNDHYRDVIMGANASQITSLTVVYSTVYSGADQRKHKSSASMAFVRGNHRRPVNSPHKWPVMRKMFPFDDVIMILINKITANISIEPILAWPGKTPSLTSQVSRNDITKPVLCKICPLFPLMRHSGRQHN